QHINLQSFPTRRSSDLQKVNKNKTTWHFKADQILDFAWGADKDYVVSKREMDNGPTLYFLRKNDDNIKENWEKAEGITMQFFDLDRKSTRLNSSHVKIS